jgi:hypothetical protein
MKIRRGDFVKALTACLVLLLSVPASDAPVAVSSEVAAANTDGGRLMMPPPRSAAQNALALRRFFALTEKSTLQIPAGTYLLPCGSEFVAAGALSIVGAGSGHTVLRLEGTCAVRGALMAWTSKSNVHLSGFTLDLNNGQSAALQNVLQFEAYEGSATGLQVDHIAILNGNTLSLQIAVAAAGGFTYWGVVISGNRLEMTPGTTQNECIALTTVQGSGKIPSARITDNICRGSGIQVDGEGPLVTGNDVSGYQFGTGIFAAFVQRTKGFIAHEPSSRDCIIRGNVLHDTPQTLDVNRTAPGGIENNCVDSLVENNEAFDLGGAGFINYASGARYVGNRARGVGFTGRGSAGGDGDNAAFVVSDNGSGMPWYRSSGLVLEKNSSEPQGGRPRFGYFEEPWHSFNTTRRSNSFEASGQSMVVRSP